MFDEDSIWRLSQGLQGVEPLQSTDDAYRVTVLTSNGVSLAKTCGLRKGRVHWEDYARAKTFDFRTHTFDTFAGLCAFVDRLAPNYQSAIIYGALHPKFDKHARLRQRLLYRGDGDEDGTIVEATHAWLPIDFDEDSAPPDGIDPVNDPEGAADYVISKLPPEFHGAEHYWRLTSKAGFSPGVRIRLIFPLNRPITNSEAKRWLAPAPVDGSIYGSAQPIYTANPLFEFPINDPISRRSGFRPGKIVEVPEIPAEEPKGQRTHTRACQKGQEYDSAAVPEGLDETDDDPELLAECKRIVANFVRTQGEGTTGTGGRAYRLINWLVDLRTAEGLVASAGLIFDVMHEDFPETTLQYIEEKLAERDRKGTRGCKLIGSEPKDEDEPDDAEPTGQEEEVAEEQRPFLWKPSAARTEVSEQVWQFISNPRRLRLLVRVTPGIGKTKRVIEALVRYIGKPPPRRNGAWEDDDNLTDTENVMEMDLRGLSKIVYSVPTHKLAQQVAKDLKAALLKAGFTPEKVEKMVTVLEGRDRMCRRPEAVRALTNKGRSAMQACERKYKDGAGEWQLERCPFLESGECQYIPLKRQAPKSTFVIMTHAQLVLEAAQAEKSSYENEYFFDLKNADLVVIDEDVTANLFDERALVLKPGFFQDILPLGRRKPRKLVEELTRLGEMIDEGLAAPEGLLAFLRSAGIKAETLRGAAEIRRKVEQKQSRVVTPVMSNAEIIERADKKRMFVRASIILDRLAVEMEAGCTHSGSLWLNAAGKVEARGLKPIRELLERKLLILDGTANHAELSRIIPDLEEFRLDVERNAYFIKIRDHVFSKSACLERVKGKDGKERYVPTEFLERAYRVVDFFVRLGLKTLVVTTKDIRCAMTGEDRKGKLEHYTEFRGALITHYGNLTGLNDYEDCQVEIQIGRELMPATATEPDAAAINHPDPNPIRRITPDAKGHKPYSSRTSHQLMRDGSYMKVKKQAYHEDERVDWRRQSMCEAQLLQGADRLRLCDEEAPAKLVVSLVSVPTEQPVNVMPTLEELYAALDLYEWLEGLAARGLRAAAVRADLLARGRPDLWARKGIAALWKKLVFPSTSSNPPSLNFPIRIDIILNRLMQRQGVSPTLCSDYAFREGWNVGKYRTAARDDGSLFVYQGDKPNRDQLAADLEVAPEDLVMMTLDNQPLAAEGETPTTGDARLDQVLALCAARGMALPLDPKALAELPGSPWSTPKSAEHWKAGVAVREILKLGPPEGWRLAEYRIVASRGRRSSAAWVPDGVEPRAAIALALSVEPDEIRLLGGAAEVEPSSKHAWRRPHIVELELDMEEADTPVPPAFATIPAMPTEGASA